MEHFDFVVWTKNVTYLNIGLKMSLETEHFCIFLSFSVNYIQVHYIYIFTIIWLCVLKYASYVMN